MSKHFLIFIFLILCSCSETTFIIDSVKRITQFHDKGTKYKIGNPYQINGQWFYPEVDYDYDAIGIASWYGPNFNGKKTANGEIFDQNKVSAAHKTLPMPSIVKVINLENRKELILKINDRGPFVNGRIIDLSKEAARQLGFLNKGTAKVRVIVQEVESRRLAMNLQNNTQKDQFDVKPARTEDIQKVELDTIKPKHTNISTNKKVIIQVGSFKDEKNAHLLVERLKNFNAFLQKHLIKENFFYRVRIGPFNDFSNAKKTLNKLLFLGFNSSKIIPNYE